MSRCVLLIGLVALATTTGCTAAVAPAATPTPRASASSLALCRAEAGNICTVAGTGNAQFDGDGRPPLDTSFYLPIDVAFDPQGRLYIDDFNNFRVRRVEANGLVRTYMGFDFEGFPTTGAKANRTPLHHPYTIQFDANGTFFLAGYHAPNVMRVDPDDSVTVLAGTGNEGFSGNDGPAVQALLASPTGVARMADGSILVADSGNNCIRRIDPNRVMRQFAGTTVAGDSGDGGPALAAQLNGPLRVTVGPTGEVFVADTLNHRIRKIAPDGTISTVAGSGVAGFAGDGGPAAAARLNQPRMATFGPDGLLYIADSFNDRVRRIRADGTIETVVGTGTRGFTGDGGAASAAQLQIPSAVRFDAQGNLFIADTNNHRVRRVFGVAPRG